MRKLKKKLAALVVGLGVITASVMSLSVSAAQLDNWPASYTPKAGTFYADSNQVRVSNVYWTQTQYSGMVAAYPCDNNWWHSIEFEFRPHLDPSGASSYPPSKNYIWGTTSTTSSNFPSAYAIYENQADDADDVSVGCKKIDAITPGAQYYASMVMKSIPSAPSAQDYTFETEIGICPANGSDSWPLRYSRYLNGLNNVWFGQTYSWS